MKNKKMLLIVVSIAVIAIILAIVITLLLLNRNKNEIQEEDRINVEQLESNFNTIFNNEENEYVSKLYYIKEEKSGKYKIEANIPYIQISDNIDNQINKEINDIFVNKILQIYNQSQNYTILTMDYATYADGDIVSVMIRCVLKEGVNAQRKIIKTYNYNIKENRFVAITDLIPETEREKVQTQIKEKIQNEIKREKTIVEQGYPVYRRDENSEIYILENATEFYIDNNVLYIIYSYGNSNYTGETDIIITEI